MPLANLLLIAIAIFVAIIVAGALIGALINLIQCLFFAAIAAAGATVAIRLLARRPPPASCQLIDQSAPNEPSDDPDRVAKQLQERVERLRRDK